MGQAAVKMERCSGCGQMFGTIRKTEGEPLCARCLTKAMQPFRKVKVRIEAMVTRNYECEVEITEAEYRELEDPEGWTLARGERLAKLLERVGGKPKDVDSELWDLELL